MACSFVCMLFNRANNFVTVFLNAGGGRGPVFSAIGKVRPSYQTTDEYTVELPSYATKEALPPSLQRKDTSKRMGFTW